MLRIFRFGCALLITAATASKTSAETFVSFTNISDRLNFRTKGDFHGAAWLDYDRDGKQDLFVTNGPSHSYPPALYHNLGEGTFANVTVPAGLAEFSRLSGVVTGDLDNDGYEDILLSGDSSRIFVNNNSSVRVLRNQGNGTFANVSADAGIT